MMTVEVAASAMKTYVLFFEKNFGKTRVLGVMIFQNEKPTSFLHTKVEKCLRLSVPSAYVYVLCICVCVGAWKLLKWTIDGGDRCVHNVRTRQRERCCEFS